MQIGIFYVQRDMLGKPVLVKTLHSMQFIPTRVEYIFHQSAFEYVGISPLFDEVKDGDPVPAYDIEVTDGKVMAKKIG